MAKKKKKKTTPPKTKKPSKPRQRYRPVNGRHVKPGLPLGINTKAFREAKGWSQPELGAESGLGVYKIRWIEQGVCSNPKVWDLHSLAVTLGTTIEVLLGLREPE